MPFSVASEVGCFSCDWVRGVGGRVGGFIQIALIHSD